MRKSGNVASIIGGAIFFISLFWLGFTEKDWGSILFIPVLFIGGLALLIGLYRMRIISFSKETKTKLIASLVAPISLIAILTFMSFLAFWHEELSTRLFAQIIVLLLISTLFFTSLKSFNSNKYPLLIALLVNVLISFASVTLPVRTPSISLGLYESIKVVLAWDYIFLLPLGILWIIAFAILLIPDKKKTLEESTE